MQREEMKLKPTRGEVVQNDEFGHANRQDYFRGSRVTRGEGSKSSPLPLRHLNTPILNLRSRSEGNLIAAQMIELKSRREIEAQHERTLLQLPKLHRDLSANFGLNQERLHTNDPKPVKELPRNNNDIKSRTFAMLRDTDRKRLLKRHIEQQEGEYRAGENKRDSLLRWLSEQNISRKGV